jgi:hypothetical protein
MLIDDNLISIDAASLTGAITSTAVPLTSFLKPGRVEPIPLVIMANEAAAGGTSVTFKVQQADEANGSFSDVPGASYTVAAADLVPGKNVGPRFVPSGVTKKWIKVVATTAGTFTAGKVSAAVVREDELMQEAGMYIDAGTVLA